MTFITSDPIAPYRHALNAWVSPLATCALPKGVSYLLTKRSVRSGGASTGRSAEDYTSPNRTLSMTLRPRCCLFPPDIYTPGSKQATGKRHVT